MKTLFKDVIAQGHYDLTDMLKKIDKHHISGNLSDEDRDELINLARGGAKTENGVNVFEKLLELEKRISALEAGEEPTETETPEEYVVGKWYHNGDKITFKDKIYTCTAPEGVVCTWSPDEYPAYWD